MFVLTGKTDRVSTLSAGVRAGQRVSEFEWAERISYVGEACPGGVDGFGHSSMPMLRSGDLRINFKTSSPSDLSFCRNGCFEIVVNSTLADALRATFPNVRLDRVEVENAKLLGQDFYEVVRPIESSIDLPRSGFELKKRCEVCSFNEKARVRISGLHLVGCPEGVDVWTTIQNPFLCLISDRLADFLLKHSHSAFSLINLEDW